LAAGAERLEWLSTNDQPAEEEALEFEHFGVSPTLFLEEALPNTPEPTIEELRTQLAATLGRAGIA
jgi:hypothetical protein